MQDLRAKGRSFSNPQYLLVRHGPSLACPRNSRWPFAATSTTGNTSVDASAASCSASGGHGPVPQLGGQRGRGFVTLLPNRRNCVTGKGNFVSVVQFIAKPRGRRSEGPGQVQKGSTLSDIGLNQHYQSCRPTSGKKLSVSAKQKPAGFWPAGFSNNPAMTYSRVRRHYHRPWMLNGRVRNGNGCCHPGIVTGKLLGLQIADLRLQI
jgi:hypothetical protein